MRTLLSAESSAFRNSPLRTRVSALLFHTSSRAARREIRVTMKHSSLENSWDSIKGQLQQRYAQLTDDDLAFVTGKAEELLARLREKLGLSAHDLNELLHELKANANGRMEQVKAKAEDFADEVRAKLGNAAEEVRAQAGVAYDEARQRVRTLREDGEEYVRQNPRETLLAAVCAGFVAGLLIRR